MVAHDLNPGSLDLATAVHSNSDLTEEVHLDHVIKPTKVITKLTLDV